MALPEMSPIRSTALVVRAYDRLIDGLAVLAGVAILVTMTTVTADVLLRALADLSLPWSFETTEYALLYILCLAMAWLARRRGHVTVDLLARQLPPVAARRLDGLAALGAAAICGSVALWGAEATIDAWQREIVIYGVLPMPRWALLAAIPIGFALTAVEYLRHARRGLLGTEPLPRQIG